MIALGNRVHIFARPDSKDRLVRFFSEILECGEPLSMQIPGSAMHILAFTFPNGASLSVEFTDEASEETEVHRGAWLEVVTDEPMGLQRRILEAGLPRVEYLGTGFFYFQAPGGQVMRIAGTNGAAGA